MRIILLKIIFITGASGSGKSTLVELLKQALPRSQFAVYDFDENGVPENADRAWRQYTTDFWLSKGQANGLHGRSTIICGVTVPSEILQSIVKPNLPIEFGLIKISDDMIRGRLQQRGWSSQSIQDNINWAKYLEDEVQRQPNYFIVDCDIDTTKEQVLEQVLRFL